MNESPGDRAPIAWEALAAELADSLGTPDDADQPAQVEAWDVVAARLAAGLRAPADAPPSDALLPGHAGLDRPAAADDRAVAHDRDVAEHPVEERVRPADPRALRGGLEALLFVVDAPVDEATLAQALGRSVGQVRDELAGLAADYDQRHAGVTLRRVGEGWRVYTREEYGDVVEGYLLEGQRSRLTQAALETLAVVAYRQPVTRARVSAIRGVGVDAVVRTLVNRGLIYECGSDPDSGGGLYATTPLFLERLGLSDLDELPELAPLLPETSSVLDEHPGV